MACKRLYLKDDFPQLSNEGTNPRADVYLPAPLEEMGREGQKRPVPVICPGGAYRFCSRREAEPIALHFLTDGYCVLVLSYSVAPKMFPRQLQEVAGVLELICQSAEQWHCDTEKIALMGFSAGGHLAARYANAYDIPQVRWAVPHSKGVQASLLCYPVISSREDLRHAGSFRNLTGTEECTRWEQVSCEKLVTEKTPPTFLWHTAKDNAVPVANTLVYGQALAEHGVPFEMHIFPEGAHGLATADGVTNDSIPAGVGKNALWLPLAKEWLKGIFGNQTRENS